MASGFCVCRNECVLVPYMEAGNSGRELSHGFTLGLVPGALGGLSGGGLWTDRGVQFREEVGVNYVNL